MANIAIILAGGIGSRLGSDCLLYTSPTSTRSILRLTNYCVKPWIHVSSIVFLGIKVMHTSRRMWTNLSLIHIFHNDSSLDRSGSKSRKSNKW